MSIFIILAVSSNHKNAVILFMFSLEVLEANPQPVHWCKLAPDDVYVMFYN